MDINSELRFSSDLSISMMVFTKPRKTPGRSTLNRTLASTCVQSTVDMVERAVMRFIIFFPIKIRISSRIFSVYPSYIRVGMTTILVKCVDTLDEFHFENSVLPDHRALDNRAPTFSGRFNGYIKY